ncbi:MAG: hypothetical protein VKJ05_04235 [Synechococcaceae cyanobacterium]|nr:hypothetical protein [Synechococcaceae cyanobacterium]
MAVPVASGIPHRLLLGALLFLLPAAATPLQAAPADPPYPSSAALRALQLATLNCGRDNAAAPCEQARRDADALLDHPRLPGRCKDVLWEIRQKAVATPSNSLSRREPIDAAGREVVVACRQLQRPTPKKDGQESKPGGAGGGFGFGGGGGGSAAP